MKKSSLFDNLVKYWPVVLILVMAIKEAFEKYRELKGVDQPKVAAEPAKPVRMDKNEFDNETA